VRHAANDATDLDVVFSRRLYAPPFSGIAVPACNNDPSYRNGQYGEGWKKISYLAVYKLVKVENNANYQKT
jgi:hypothetical protein